MDFSFVTLSEIDLNDSAFEIRKFAGSTRLRESLDRFGILDPPWLRRKGGGYIVVDGFQRLYWAKQNGMQGTVCRIFPEDFDLIELWMRKIERMREREINPAEKAQIISTLVRLFQPGEIPRFLLSDLNVANRGDVVHRLVLLSATGVETLEILASGAIAERAALEVAGWDQRSRDSVLTVLQALRCSASIQVEIAEGINEVAVREERAGADIIEALRTREILGAKEFNRRQKTQALRDFLAELRHPRLSSRQKRFRKEIEALGLPPEVRIIPPVAFEGDNWRMELSFSGPGELRKAIGSAESLVGSGRLNTILCPSGKSG